MIVLFCGPSLPPSECPKQAGLEILPPVAQGDVYQAARQKPWGIGIIDGVFERVPAVWHKEILWAMSQGIHVFGGASMGALRACELATFGMVGVGWIFDQYRSGQITADDEVAIVHAAAEYEYRPGSEALVNMRQTLSAAARENVCTLVQVAQLIELAAQQFYPDRCWPALLDSAKRSGVDPTMLTRLETWLPNHTINQKRLDALALVETMLAERKSQPGPLRVEYQFEKTNAWELGVVLMGDKSIPPKVTEEPEEAVDVEDLLVELRLAGSESLYNTAINGALLRCHTETITNNVEWEVDDAQLRTATGVFRRQRELKTAEQTLAWLTEQGLKNEAFVDLMVDEARLQVLGTACAEKMLHHLPSQLRAMGCFGQLSRRVQAKRAAAAESEAEKMPNEGSFEDLGELWRWYFCDHLQREVPQNLACYAEKFGFVDQKALCGAVKREQDFQRAPLLHK